MAKFWSRLKKAASETVGTGRYEAAGKQIICPHCGGPWFEQSNAQLNTAGMTFFNLDWANRSATVLTCTCCSRIEWFLEEPARIA